jgi:hypothetical protein
MPSGKSYTVRRFGYKVRQSAETDSLSRTREMAGVRAMKLSHCTDAQGA